MAHVILGLASTENQRLGHQLLELAQPNPVPGMFPCYHPPGKLLLGIQASALTLGFFHVTPIGKQATPHVQCVLSCQRNCNTYLSL